jgi:methyl-accepting chemotaxis protein
MHAPHEPAAAAPTPALHRLGTRLLAVFGCSLLLCLVGSAIGVHSLVQVDRETQRTIGQGLVRERLAGEAYRLQSVNAARYKAFALSSEPEVGETLVQDIQRTHAQYSERMAQLRTQLLTPQDQQTLQRTAQAEQTLADAVVALVAARDSGLTARIAQVYAERFEPASDAVLAQLDALVQAQRQAIDAAGQDIAARSASARHAQLGFGATALLLGGLLIVWLLRHIAGPIRLASTTAVRVAALDLRTDIRVQGRDETGQLLRALARMQQALRSLVGEVRAHADGVREAADEVVQRNQDLSQRTGSADAALQDVALALAQMADRLAQATASSQQADRCARDAVAQAARSQDAVVSVQATMDTIERDTRRVADVIGLVDSIAFQTNLLALNAAVEAARAGDAGRGFAVVAAEVRGLANRSASAAQEIKTLVARSIASVERGTRLVESATGSTEQLRQGIREIGQLMAQIAGGNDSQNQDLAQIHAAVQQLERISQGNAAQVHASALNAQGLAQQAQSLHGLIGRFALPAAGA